LAAADCSLAPLGDPWCSPTREEGFFMQPIIKMYLGRHTPDWDALTAEEQDMLSMEAHAALDMCGGRWTLDCSVIQPEDGWQWFGIEIFPNQQALVQYHDALAALGWYRYVVELNVFGIERELPPYVTGADQSRPAEPPEG
jgi:hypothetical protein